MSVSLHAASIGAYLQILPTVAGMIDKAEAYCTDRGIAPEELTGARLWLPPEVWAWLTATSC